MYSLLHVLIEPSDLFEYMVIAEIALLIGYIGYRFIKAIFDAE